MSLVIVEIYLIYFFNNILINYDKIFLNEINFVKKKRFLISMVFNCKVGKYYLLSLELLFFVYFD